MNIQFIARNNVDLVCREIVIRVPYLGESSEELKQRIFDLVKPVYLLPSPWTSIDDHQEIPGFDELLLK